MRASAATRLLFALLLCSAAARAEGTAPSVSGGPTGPAPSPHLAAAQRLYQKLDLEAAMAELREAEIASKDNEDETVQIFIYRGMIFSETGKTADAADMFKRALAMRPWAEVPPDTSPRLAKVFGDARKALWGSGGQLKPPPKKRGLATPASTSSNTVTVPPPMTVPLNPPSAAPASAPAAAPATPAEAPAPAPK